MLKFSKKSDLKATRKQTFKVYKLKHYIQTNGDNHNERKMKK
jgi:hypothetical protein